MGCAAHVGSLKTRTGITKSPPARMPTQKQNFTEDTSMSFSVVTNISSLNSQISLTRTNEGLQKTLARLSSGLRINSSADDAAGLAIANRDMLDNTDLTVGIQASNDAISALQIKD